MPRKKSVFRLFLFDTSHLPHATLLTQKLLSDTQVYGSSAPICQLSALDNS